MTLSKKSIIEEIGFMIARSGHHSDLLKQIVLLIRSRFHADACTLFLLNKAGDKLSLKASVGLFDEKVSSFQIPIEYGLTGQTAKYKRKTIVQDVRDNPKFKTISS